MKNVVVDSWFSGETMKGGEGHEMLSRLISRTSTKRANNIVLKSSWIETQLGQMLAIGDEHHLHLLEFSTCRGLEKSIERFLIKNRLTLEPGRSASILSIQEELKRYFQGELKAFKTPIKCYGSPFQTQVWKALQAIPFGQTISYSELAANIGRPSACRAVAQANASNQLAIVIPCHRVISANGKIGGYAGGIGRKERLLHLEKQSSRGSPSDR